MKSEVAVIIPYYNNSLKLLKETLQSIIRQTFKNFQIYIVNDGSFKKKRNLLYDLIISLNDKRLQILDKDNGGTGDARSYGVKNVKEKYIAFCDADDLWKKNKLEEQYKFLENNSEYGFVACHHYRMYCDKKNIEIKTKINKQLMPKEPVKMLIRLLYSPSYGGGNPSTYFFRKKVYSKAMPYMLTGKNDCEDISMLLALAYTGCIFGIVDKQLSYYRVHDNNRSKFVCSEYNYNLKHIIYYLNLSRDVLIKNNYEYSEIEKNSLYNAYLRYSGRLSDVNKYKEAHKNICMALKYRVTSKALRRCIKYYCFRIVSKTFVDGRDKVSQKWSFKNEPP